MKRYVSFFIPVIVSLYAMAGMEHVLAQSMALAEKEQQPSPAHSGAYPLKLKELLNELGRKYQVNILFEESTVPDILVNKEDLGEKQQLDKQLENLLKPYQLRFEKLGSSYLIIREKRQKPGKLPEATTLNSIILSNTSLNSAAKVLTPTMQLITGKVTNEKGEGIPGVSVLLKGTTTGTATNGEGNYQLSVSTDTGTLVFSYIGYATQEIPIDGQTVINVSLESGVKSLSEVVVVGYGTVKKSDVTGSVAQIKSEDLNAFPVTNPVQGLTGKAPGVQVMQNSGEPGTTLSVRIRGGNSLRGSNEPLYVVDGFALAASPNALNPADIESIEVLKDASATAIYGSRGANGVVLITTKRGKAGKSQVDIDSYYGVQQVIKRLDLLNAREFAQIANERAANDGVKPFFSQEEIDGLGEGTDWQHELFRPAPIQNHVLTFSGGSEKTQYSVSGSYFGQQGILKGSDYWRVSLRANVNQQVSKKISLSYNSILSHLQRSRLDSDNGARGSGVLSGALAAPPTLAPRTPEGTYTIVNGYPFSPSVLQNPLALALERQEAIKENFILANTALTYEPIAGLTFRVSAGVENNPNRREFYSPRILTTSPTGSASITFGEHTNILNENIITYTRKFTKDHTFTVTGGITYQNEKTSSATSSASGFSTDVLGTNALGSASTPGVPTSGVSKWTLLSHSGRLPDRCF